MSSVFEWNTGQPSIFGGTSANPANIRPAPPLKRISKPKDYTPKTEWVTKPLVDRLDMLAVRDFRLSGKSWDEVAAQFNCSKKAIFERLRDLYPETRNVRGAGKPRGGTKPRVQMPLAQMMADIAAGESLKATARRYKTSHATLARRLRETPEGLAVIRMAQERAILRNNSAHPFGSVHIPTRAEQDRTNSIRGR